VSSHATVLSFGAQALRYFDRPHTGVRREPIEGPAAWRGPDLAARSDWITTLAAAQIRELDTALSAARRRGVALERLSREAFPLPTLAPVIRSWAAELSRGRGLVLVRGLPVERWGDDDAARVYWGIGQYLGEPGAQNPQGDLLGHVVDTGDDATNPFVRLYRTPANIAYHCDLADAVGLLCLRTAAAGGASRIVSSVSVYNELLARRPDLAARLYEPFRLDTRDEGSDKLHFVPVTPCRHAAGVLRTFYHSDYFRSVVRHAEVPPFTDEESELLDLYEEIASSPALYLDLRFEPGDLQLISNHFVLHARTAYTDDPAAGKQRHLLRLWLSLDAKTR
jgi:hypothetical protein